MRKIILVTGASGYIGGRLLRELERMNLPIRCMVRKPAYVVNKVKDSTEIIKGDVFDIQSLEKALDNVDTAFYNIHSLGGAHDDFEERDKIAASNFVQAAAKCGVKKIVYLGGLGRGGNLSKHLESRQEVGRILGSSGIPLIEFRASIVIGSGSISFEMVRSLVEKLPVMTTPKWVRTLAQPISIEDVIKYLVCALEYEAKGHEIFEIGGKDQVSYEDIMRIYGEERGLKRLVIHFPFLTPRLSSHWLNLVTPLYHRIGKWLIDGVKNETLVVDKRSLDVFPVEPMGIKAAVSRALKNEDREIEETHWTDAHGVDHLPEFHKTQHSGSRVIYSQSILIEAPPEEVFLPIQYVGGHKGWYSYQWLWDLRAFIDKLIGGAGKRGGRRDPLILIPGDVVDFWRVEKLEMYELLRLKADMKMPGRGWLQFELNPIHSPQGEEHTQLSINAIFDPLGVAGRLYWIVLYPFHKLIFTRMLFSIRASVIH